MFAEVEFGSSPESATPSSGAQSLLVSPQWLRVPMPSFGGELVPDEADGYLGLALHKPGDAGFSVVAGAAADSGGRYDSRQISGDCWGSVCCRCLSCETLRVCAKLRSLQQRRAAAAGAVTTVGVDPPVVLLVDLDNYGFNQFKCAAPKMASEAGGPSRWCGRGRGRVAATAVAGSPPPPGGQPSSRGSIFDSVFLWAFYGSCFTRHHGVVPDAESACMGFGGAAAARDGALDRARRPAASIWKRLVDAQAVHFTPCAGCPQAVDNVLLQVVDSLLTSTAHRVVLISGDGELVRAAGAVARRTTSDGDGASDEERHSPRKRRRKSGGASGSEGESAGGSTGAWDQRFAVVNVLTHRKRLRPIWADICASVERLLGSA